MGKIHCDEFIQDDVDYIIMKANFTPEQLDVFRELCSGRYTDVGIYMKLCMSESKYYSVKRKVMNKIIRILG